MALFEKNWYTVPWKLVPNKIVRYPGGREIDRFRGIFPGTDDGRPEAWVGSDTRTVDAAEKGDPNDGCAEVMLPDGSRRYLFEAVEADPEAALGAAHIARNGARVGVLVKLLDAEKQLGLQTHPTRAYAKEWFGSDYGKEESWYVIGKREDSPETPYVYMGFKAGVTREMFEAAFDRGDIRAMEDCCHKIPVEVGDAFFIQAGLPHAIGCGCFVAEVQEPSDITVGAHKLPDGTPEEQAFHKERLLGCYIYNGADYAENLRRYRIEPKRLRGGDWGEERVVIGTAQTPYFSFTQLTAEKPVALKRTGTPQIAVVLEGGGTLRCGEAAMPVQKADEFFIPYSAGEITLEPQDRTVLLLCNPAGADYGAQA